MLTKMISLNDSPLLSLSFSTGHQGIRYCGCPPRPGIAGSIHQGARLPAACARETHTSTHHCAYMYFVFAPHISHTGLLLVESEVELCGQGIWGKVSPHCQSRAMWRTQRKGGHVLRATDKWQTPQLGIQEALINAAVQEVRDCVETQSEVERKVHI